LSTMAVRLSFTAIINGVIPCCNTNTSQFNSVQFNSIQFNSIFLTSIHNIVNEPTIKTQTCIIYTLYTILNTNCLGSFVTFMYDFQYIAFEFEFLV
jgi:hypothetical protein